MEQKGKLYETVMKLAAMEELRKELPLSRCDLEAMTKKQLMKQYIVKHQIPYPNRGPMANKPIFENTSKNKKWLIDRIIEFTRGQD